MDATERETGCMIECVDIGGRLTSRNALQGVHLRPEKPVLGFEQYAEAITGALLEATRCLVAAGKLLPVLVLETGRAVVDDAETLVMRVAANKRLPDGWRAGRVARLRCGARGHGARGSGPAQIGAANWLVRICRFVMSGLN